MIKLSTKILLYFYVTTVYVLSIYILTAIRECDAYWMHDISIKITKLKLLIDASFLFVLPMVIITVQKLLKITIQTNLFLTNYFISLTSILLLLAAINVPCESLNGGHYMFINSTMALGYYLFKFLGFGIILMILLRGKKIKHTLNEIATVSTKDKKIENPT